MKLKKILIAEILLLIALFALSGCIGVKNPPRDSGNISLLDLPIKTYHVDYGDLWIGKNVNQRKVYLHKNQITDYFFAHASSRIVFDIPEGVKSFNAWGVRPHGDEAVVVGSWCYIIKIDGKEAFHSRALSEYKNSEVPINVQIPTGAKVIELIVDNMHNGFCDHSIWAVPVFRK